MARTKAKRQATPRKPVAAQAPKPKRAKSAPAKKPAPVPRTKTEACLALLTRAEGASIEELQQATGWQAHSVRGFLAGTVKKIPGASLTSDKPADRRRYYLRRA